MGIVTAILLSLFAPGAGQAYNGERRKAYGYAGFYLVMLLIILPFSLRLMRGNAHSMMGVALAAGFPFITLVAVVDAAGRAYETRKGKRIAEGGGFKIGLIVLVVFYALKFLGKISGIPARIAEF